MPELPEVEITKLGILPTVTNNPIQSVIIRNPQLRWPIPKQLPKILPGQIIQQINRRGRYLLLIIDSGSVLIHLGMSGSLTTKSSTNYALQKHDHFGLIMQSGEQIILNDPRRFGAVLWADHHQTHPLLAKMGPEPLSTQFNSQYLYQRISKRNIAIKPLIMNNQIVPGVGNIYATEALFDAKINPTTTASRLSIEMCHQLVTSIKQTLRQAIKLGGTTLKDFNHSDGKPGYFQQQLQVYGRAGKPCVTCGEQLIGIRQAQRATVFCPICQANCA